MGIQTKEDAIEILRTKIVSSMKTGKLLVINLGKT